MKSYKLTRFYGFLTTIAIAVSFYTSCSEPLNDTYTTVKEGDLVDVTINVSVDAMNSNTDMKGQECVTKGDTENDIVCSVVPSATLSVKATGYNDNVSVADIINLLVVQFDGEDDNAQYVKQKYIENYQIEENRTVQLVASPSKKNTIVCFANTFDPTLSFANQTLGACKKYKKRASNLSDVVSLAPGSYDSTTSFPLDGEYYQRMNGSIQSVITDTTPLPTISLTHNVSKLTVRIKNEAGNKSTNPVTLKSADLLNIPACIYYYTENRDATSKAVGYPTDADIALYGKYDCGNVILWDNADPTNMEGKSAATKEAFLYIPENQSGVVANNTNEKLKTMYAPSRATKLRLNATFNDGKGHDLPVTYTFALGSDMINNYQLFPNGNYVYEITIKARGDKTTDSRVTYQEANGVDYTDLTTWPLSNCYICNPATVPGLKASYKIPVARVDQFWGSRYENVPTNMLTPPGSQGESNWEVSVIWSDVPVTDENIIFTKKTGTGANDYFSFDIPYNPTRDADGKFIDDHLGNIIVGIKKQGGTDWLWSWHLWITDYCPDEARFLYQQGAIVAGSDSYTVTNGKVYRYSAASDPKNQKFVMDRSVGALSNEYRGYVKGIFYYQFGRKDPFPVSSSAVHYYNRGTEDQTSVWSKNPEGENNKTVDRANTGAVPIYNNVQFSIKNPQTFISGGAYTYDDKYNPKTYNANIVWHDPYASDNGGKSIFDPSPSGWKFRFVDLNSGVASTSNGGSWLNSSVSGRTPGSIFLPWHGHRTATGALDQFSTYSWVFTSLRNNESLNINNSYIGTSIQGSWTNKGNSNPVYCIQQ